MRILLIFLLLLPIFSSGQIGEDFYDIDKDKYYYDLLKEKNSMEYDWEVKTISDTSQKTVIQSTAFYYSEYDGKKRYLDFKELDIIYGNSKGKITGIAEEKHNDGDTRFSELSISYAFEKFGNPERKINNETIILKGKSYFFERGYLWNILRDGKTSEMYIGVIVETKNIYNKRGKIKSSKTDRYNLTFYIPKGKNNNESELDFIKRNEESQKIGEGFFKAYKRDYINNSLFQDKIKTYGNKLVQSALFSPNDNDAPTDYIQLFKQLSVLLYENIIWGAFLDVEPKITFTSLEGSTIAIAKGMNNNCELDILVDITKWNNASHSERIFIMFHELGHDIYNLKHSDGLRLMATSSYNVEDKELLGEIIHEMFYYLNSKSGYLDIQCVNTTSS